MSLGVACRFLQPFIDARAHPTSVRSSHASGAFAPLLAGTNRCRLRWFHGALPHQEPASHGLFAPAFAVAFHLRGRDRLWAEAPEQRQTRGLGRFARALLVALRAPGSPTRLVVRSGEPLASSLRPRSLSDAAPRRATPLKRPRCFLSRWNPYVTGGLLLRARLGRSTVTPPPKRHCSGALAPFSPLLQRLPLTRKAPEPARPSEPWEPKPPGGLAGRCAHHDIYDRISSRADVPRTSWALSRTNQVSTQYKKHPNNAFFLALLAHRVVHSFSTQSALSLGISRALLQVALWADACAVAICTY